MKFYIVDAFTSVPFGGNTAGVVLLEDDKGFPSDTLMQRIAAQLRYSETAFIKQNGEKDFTIRYFTPEGEVDLCGHATIASFKVLMECGRTTEGDVCLNRTLAGDLNVYVGEQIMMDMATPQVVGKEVEMKDLYRIMAGREMETLQELPVEIISTGLPDIILPLASVEELQSLKPDMQALAKLSKELEVTGVHAFAIADDNYTAHVRNFAPLYGIDEESATGTANGALSYYLFRHGIAKEGDRCTYLQGEAMGRASEITAKVMAGGKIKVGGNAAIMASGELLL